MLASSALPTRQSNPDSKRFRVDVDGTPFVVRGGVTSAASPTTAQKDPGLQYSIVRDARLLNHTRNWKQPTNERAGKMIDKISHISPQSYRLLGQEEGFLSSFTDELLLWPVCSSIPIS